MEKKNIINNYTLEEYNKKYKNRNHRLLKHTKLEVEDFDKKYGYFTYNCKTQSLNFKNHLLKNRKWALINDTYYEIPKPIRFTWFRNLSVGIQASTCLLGVGIIATAITIPSIILSQQIDEKIVLDDESLKDIEIPKFEKKGENYVATLKAKDDTKKVVIVEVKKGNDILIKNEHYTYVEDSHLLTILGEKTKDIKGKITIKAKVEENLSYKIDWKTKLYNIAKTAVSIEFKQSDDTSGILCGETEDDKIYYSFDNSKKEMVVWSKGKIIFEDNDKLRLTKGYFADCNKLKRIILKNIDTSRVTDMSFTFSACGDYDNPIEVLDLSSFNTANVINFNNMFEYCYAKEIILSSFETKNAKKMNSMFYNCFFLSSLDLSSFDTSNLETMNLMFGSDFGIRESDLVSIYVTNNFVINKVTSTGTVFSGLENLVGGNGTKFSAVGSKDKSYAVIDKEGQPGYFTEKK